MAKELRLTAIGINTRSRSRSRIIYNAELCSAVQTVQTVQIALYRRLVSDSGANIAMIKRVAAQ